MVVYHRTTAKVRECRAWAVSEHNRRVKEIEELGLSSTLIGKYIKAMKIQGWNCAGKDAKEEYLPAYKTVQRQLVLAGIGECASEDSTDGSYLSDNARSVKQIKKPLCKWNSRGCILR